MLIGELNKVLATVHDNEDVFIKRISDSSDDQNRKDIESANKSIEKFRNRIDEIN